MKSMQNFWLMYFISIKLKSKTELHLKKSKHSANAYEVQK